MKKSTASGSRGFSKQQAFFCPDPIRRPNYFAGALLSVDDFATEQNYHREKLRRHNLHCHGFGVVQGLNVSTVHKDSAWRLAITPGVAIDPTGNEIELCTTVQLPLPKSPTAIEVGIRFAERLGTPVPSLNDPASPGSQPSRVEEGCEVLLNPVATPPSSRTNGMGRNLIPGFLPLAYLVRERGAWRVSRKFKIPRAH